MMLLDMIMEFLTGTTPYHVELRTFGIAFQGAMAVRNGLNKDKKMNPFHAFAWTTILGFGGGWFTFLFLGKPTSMIASGDVNITLSFLAFLIVNYMPGDIGYKLGMSLPGMLLTTSLAQMFRSMGTIGFISTAAKEISPSKYSSNVDWPITNIKIPEKKVRERTKTTCVTRGNYKSHKEITGAYC